VDLLPHGAAEGAIRSGHNLTPYRIATLELALVVVGLLHNFVSREKHPENHEQEIFSNAMILRHTHHNTSQKVMPNPDALLRATQQRAASRAAEAVGTIGSKQKALADRGVSEVASVKRLVNELADSFERMREAHKQVDTKIAYAQSKLDHTNVLLERLHRHLK